MNSKDKKKLWSQLGPEADEMLKLAIRTMDIVVLYRGLKSEQEERYRNEANRILRYAFKQFDPENPMKIKGLINNALWKWAVQYAYKDPEYNQVYDENVKVDADGRVPTGVLHPDKFPGVDGRQAIICKEQIDQFSHLVSRLNKQNRLNVINRLLGWSYEKIGEKLKVSTGTARTRVRDLFNSMIDYFIEIDERTKADMLTEAM